MPDKPDKPELTFFAPLIAQPRFEVVGHALPVVSEPAAGRTGAGSTEGRGATGNNLRLSRPGGHLSHLAALERRRIDPRVLNLGPLLLDQRDRSREQLTVPVYPHPGEIVDTRPFEKPDDPDAKLVLPRYRLAKRRVSGTERPAISLERGPSGGRLELFLEPFRAPEVANLDAEEVPHRLAVTLRFTVGGMVHEKEFQSVESQGEGDDREVACVWEAASTEDLDFVYLALAEASHGAELVTTRLVKAAVPEGDGTARSEPQKLRTLRTARLALGAGALASMTGVRVRDHRDGGDENDEGARGGRSRRRRPPRTRVRDHRGESEAERRARMIRDHRESVARRIEATRGVRRPRPRPIPRPRPDDRPEPRPGDGPRYRVSVHRVDAVDPRKPFVFPPDLHPDVFAAAGGAGAGPVAARPVRHQVQFDGTWHSYYQDPADRRRFFFLPDAFKLSRRLDAPFTPALSLVFESSDGSGSLESQRARLSFVAQPVLDPARLDAAGAELAEHLPGGADDPAGVRFEPLAPDAASLRLFLPRSGGGDQTMERPGAVVDFRHEIRDELVLSIPEVQSLYDALFSDASNLFRGEVVTELASGQDDDVLREAVPFVGRLDDLVGDLLEIWEDAEPDGQELAVRLVNAIESPVRIEHLDGELVFDGVAAPARVVGVEAEIDGTMHASLPLELPPDGEVRVRLVPAMEPDSPAASGAAPGGALFDLDGVVVLPDREAVWESIVDPTAPSVYQRTVTVRGLSSWFGERDEGAPVELILVDFEGADTVELTADQLTVEVEVDLALSDLVLHRIDEGTFRYRWEAIHTDGSRSESDGWVEEERNRFVPRIVVGESP